MLKGEVLGDILAEIKPLLERYQEAHGAYEARCEELGWPVASQDAELNRLSSVEWDRWGLLAETLAQHAAGLLEAAERGMRAGALVEALREIGALSLDHGQFRVGEARDIANAALGAFEGETTSLQPEQEAL
jgi:hypothetical protein